MSDTKMVSSADRTLKSPSQTPKHLRRAKVACKSCHVRRVKCDASQSQPCWHCKMRKTPCELMDSRRGRYPRNVNKTGELHGAPTNAFVPDAEASSPVVSQETVLPEQRTTLFPYSDAGEEDDGPEMLFARMAEPEPAKESPTAFQERGRTLYLGDAFSLSFVVKIVCSSSGRGDEVKLHFPIPPSVPDRNAQTSDNSEELMLAEQAFLRAQGAFTLPEKEVSDELVSQFFLCVHPAYPIFDRRAFNTSYQQGRMSILVLQAIYFHAVIVCDEGLLKRAGFTDRYHARKTFYLRAKALHDADYEKDKVQLVAVLFLLSFWWQGPEDQKDVWHWAGCAISLAQTLGMHRSTGQSGMSQRRRSLWKRIWWSIYVRDRHAASALGRPIRIRDEDCDVEALTEADFQVDFTEYRDIVGKQATHHISYVIEMSKLAIILGRVLTAKFSPGHTTMDYDCKTLGNDLRQWEKGLPSDMARCPVDETLGAPFWACMLHATYANCQILLFRPNGVVVRSATDAQNDSMSRMAANTITHIAEDLLTAGTLRCGQLHLIPALFVAVSIHAIVMQQKDSIRTQVAENRSRQCMLALSELSKSWPVSGWILRLFISLMKRLTGRDFGFEMASQGSSLGSHPTPRKMHNSTTVTFQHVPLDASGELDPVRDMPSEGQRFSGIGQMMLTQQSLNLVSDVSRPYDLDFFDFDYIFKSSLDAFQPYNFGLNMEPDAEASWP